MKSLILIFFFVLSGCWCNIFAQYRITDGNNLLKMGLHALMLFIRVASKLLKQTYFNTLQENKI